MSSELFREGGPYDVKKTGPHQFSMSIPIPTDADGRAARECQNRSCSPAYFKVKPGTGITTGQSIAYCPYCRTSAEPSDFHTREQTRYATDVLAREAKMGVERALMDAFGLRHGGKRRLVDGLIKVDMEMKPSLPEYVRKPYEDILRRDVVCPNCTLDQSVYGFATWCSDCGTDIFATHIKTEIDVIKSIVGDVDRRRRELGVRVAVRDLENALEDLVSVFEATLKIEIRRHRRVKGDTDGEVDEVMRRIGSRLQSVPNAVSIIPQVCDGVLLFPPGSQAEITLDRVFQKRHPITHNLGVVDRKYIERVRAREAEGTEVRVEKDEIIETAENTIAALSEFHGRLFPAVTKD